MTKKSFKQLIKNSKCISLFVSFSFLFAVNLFAQKDELKTDSIKTSVAASTIDSVKEKAPASEPFAFGDFTWLNGNNRQASNILDNKFFSADFTFDLNYTKSNRNPIDNTVVGSTALTRNNEFTVSFVGIGGDFHWNNVRGRFMTQFGTRSTVIPRNDFSTYRGQYDLPDAYRYISEAYGGYHFNKWHGINLDFGIFMSYIGLFSYNNFENWGYQPSFTSDNTPWFFNGMRLQMFPTDKLKIEFWLINGWQSYAKFNKMPGLGFSVLYRPKEDISMISNNYFGTDVQGFANAKRYHTDDSFEKRYYNKPKSSRFIKRAAFSLTGDFGVQSGGPYTPFGDTTASNFISGMAYNRIWFGKDMHWAWTIGGGFIHNPSRYLVLVPPGQATDKFLNDATPASKFDGWDASTTLDYMPNDFITIRTEVVTRHSSIPYFAGHGGVTSATGYQVAPQGSSNSNSYTPQDPNFTPDLVKSELRGIFAIIVRF